MSEPEAAFIKLQVDRKGVTAWLRARPSPASRWDDWRDVGGRWYFGKGVSGLAEASQEQVRETIDEADRTLSGIADNYALLGHVLATAPAPQARIAAFDRAGGTFVAGSLMYSEDLNDFIVFLALARGAADHLAPAGHGLAIVKNVVFGTPDEEEPTVAVRMMPSGESRFLADSERASAGPAFQEIADAMLDERPLPDFPVRDQFDDLR